MKFLTFLLYLKITRRLIDSIVKNYFLIRKINKIYIRHRKLILEIDFRDSFDRVFIFKGYWEEEQIEYLISYAKKQNCDIFIDIGSNFGLYSMIFSKSIKNIDIFSYEPIKKNYEKQLRNIKLNNIESNFEIYNYGISDSNKLTFFETKNSNNFDQSSTYKVSSNGYEEGELKKFDDVNNILNKNLIIKIDIEGHEYEALNGMIKTIKNNKILLQVEIFNENFDKVNLMLLNLNFKLIKKIDSDYFYKKN